MGGKTNFDSPPRWGNTSNTASRWTNYTLAVLTKEEPTDQVSHHNSQPRIISLGRCELSRQKIVVVTNAVSLWGRHQTCHVSQTLIILSIVALAALLMLLRQNSCASVSPETTKLLERFILPQGDVHFREIDNPNLVKTVAVWVMIE